MKRVDLRPTRVRGCSRARRRWLAEVPSYGQKGDKKKHNDLGYVDGLFSHTGTVACAGRVKVAQYLVRDAV
jgi:hypothetical protein